MSHAPTLALLLALALPTAALAQVETAPPVPVQPVPSVQSIQPVLPTDVTPTEGAPNTPLGGMIEPATLDTQTPQAFINSLATKFGTNPKKLQSLLDKLPPKGKGLSNIEIAVISAKLKLTKEEKAVLKARAGAGGTGFTREDAVGMGVRLGLSDADTARLAQQLGIVSPSIATPAIVPASF
jgi:hypothetical protein